MELPHFINTRNAPECVSRRSSSTSKFKSFTYGDAQLVVEQDGGPALVVQMVARKNSRPYCSGCLKRGRPYDRLEERRFQVRPVVGNPRLPGLPDASRGCQRCGVTVEIVPWGDGKNRRTTTYRWLLAGWAKLLSWSDVGSISRTSWDSVCRAVEHAVEWGLAHRDLSGVAAVGIDEVAWQRGHTYMTLLYDISQGDEAAWPWPNTGPRRACEPAWTALGDRPARRAIRVWRYAEAVPQGDPGEPGSCGSRAGSVPRHAAVRQGVGRDPGGGRPRSW